MHGLQGIMQVMHRHRLMYRCVAESVVGDWRFPFRAFWMGSAVGLGGVSLWPNEGYAFGGALPMAGGGKQRFPLGPSRQAAWLGACRVNRDVKERRRQVCGGAQRERSA